SLKNILIDRPSKKLDWRNAPYRIIKVLSPLTYKLNTPPGIYPVFHTSLLRKKQTDPFPSQILTDLAILPALQDTEGNDEWEVEEILKEKGLKVLVKWTGYPKPTWEPRSALQDTEALARFERGEGEKE